MVMENSPASGGACFVVVGGGQAGAVAATTLRKMGFDGRLVLIGAERYLPYERPPLSKEVLVSPARAKTTLFSAADYAQQRIEGRWGVAVTALDVPARTVTLADGECIGFDKLLLATGAQARPYPLLDGLGEGVFAVRTLDDAEALRARLRAGVRLLVVGGGVIGLEVAASARGLGAEVCVIERGTRLMNRAAPLHLSQALLDLHLAQGVRVEFGAELSRAGRNEAGAIVLDAADGRRFEGDLVVYGIGVTLNDGLARQAGLAVDDGILVDGHGMTSVSGIYAAGDVARQLNPRTGRHQRQETWSNAQHQGEHVARAMLDGSSFEPDLPWYWTDQYGHNIQVAGEVEVDHWLTRGDAAGRRTQFGVRGGHIVGAITVDNGREMRPARQLVAAAAPLGDTAALLDPKCDLRRLATALAATA